MRELGVSVIRTGQLFDVAGRKQYRHRVLDRTMEILRAEKAFDSGSFLLESFETPLSIRVTGSEVIFESFAVDGTFDRAAEGLADESDNLSMGVIEHGGTPEREIDLGNDLSGAAYRFQREVARMCAQVAHAVKQ